MTTLAEHWGALASVGLLGTDRRPAPEPPPGALRDLLQADPPADHAESVLAQVAAVAAARRAGVRPAPPLASPEPCPPDERPLCPPAALRRLFELLDTEPVLLDEWLALAAAGGFRVAPDAAVALLARYRHDPRVATSSSASRARSPNGLRGSSARSSGLAGASSVHRRRCRPKFASAIGAPTDAHAIALVDRVVSDRAHARRDQPLLVRLPRPSRLPVSPPTSPRSTSGPRPGVSPRRSSSPCSTWLARDEP